MLSEFTSDFVEFELLPPPMLAMMPMRMITQKAIKTSLKQPPALFFLEDGWGIGGFFLPYT